MSASGSVTDSDIQTMLSQKFSQGSLAYGTSANHTYFVMTGSGVNGKN